VDDRSSLFTDGKSAGWDDVEVRSRRGLLRRDRVPNFGRNLSGMIPSKDVILLDDRSSAVRNSKFKGLVTLDRQLAEIEIDVKAGRFDVIEAISCQERRVLSRASSSIFRNGRVSTS